MNSGAIVGQLLVPDGCVPWTAACRTSRPSVGRAVAFCCVALLRVLRGGQGGCVLSVFDGFRAACFEPQVIPTVIPFAIRGMTWGCVGALRYAKLLSRKNLFRYRQCPTRVGGNVLCWGPRILHAGSCEARWNVLRWCPCCLLFLFPLSPVFSRFVFPFRFPLLHPNTEQRCFRACCQRCYRACCRQAVCTHTHTCISSSLLRSSSKHTHMHLIIMSIHRSSPPVVAVVIVHVTPYRRCALGPPV